jgi:polar amino acid transport system substrate-binding protein
MGRTITRFCVAALFGGFLWCQPLIIYTEISPPNQQLSPDGKIAGFATEVVQELQRRLGNTDPIEVVPWIRGYREVQTKPNVVLFSVVRSAERDPLFHWVGPLRTYEYCFYTRKDANVQIKSLSEAKQLRLVGVYKEDIRDQYLTRMGFTNLDRSIDNITALKKLMDGRVDAMAAAESGFSELATMAGFRPNDFEKRYTFLQVQTYIVFSKSTSEKIVKAWNRRFEEMKQDGVFERIHRKHFPDIPLPGPAMKAF